MVRFYHLVIPAGFEPATVCLEGRCSIQLSYGTIVNENDLQTVVCKSFHIVGTAGLEPATSWSQTTRDNQLRYAPILFSKAKRNIVKISANASTFYLFLKLHCFPTRSTTKRGNQFPRNSRFS